MTYEEMVAKIRKIPGLTLNPAEVEKIGPLEETAKQIAQETDTDLEWSNSHSPRFMPKDKKTVAEIRTLWRRFGIDPEPYNFNGDRIE